MSKWKKSSARLIAAFDAALPDDERVVRRQMFGYPAAFTGGNMICGLFEESILLRLGEERCAELLLNKQAEPFAPAGRPMRHFVAISGAATEDPRYMKTMIAESFAFVLTMKPKKKGLKKKTPARTRKIR